MFMNMHRRIFSLFILTAPLVSFSVFPGSNLPLIYLLTLVVIFVVLITKQRVPIKILGNEDLFFFLFLTSSLCSFIYNYSTYPGFKGVSQIVNLLLTYLIFKTSLFLLVRSGVDPDKILQKIFVINSIYAFLSILAYFLGLFSGTFLDIFLGVVNNSGNFDLINIGHTFSTARSFGFSPEASFWSFFVAVNISLGLILKNSNRFLLSINFFNLILTFGRTGLLITAIILLIHFGKVSIIRKLLLIFILTIGLIIFFDQLRFTSLKSVDSSFFDRFDSLIVAFGHFFENFILGIGFGNFAEVALTEKLSYHDIFNLFLNILVSSGIVGFAFFMLTLHSIYKKIVPALNLPFYASIAGWMTMSAYNLPFLWIILATLIYCSKFNQEQVIIEHDQTFSKAE